ncbi:MAG TPA: hypothetical protein VLR26_06080 [Frankiaceae bacterium]|nr:hypothetical protein [Frankiaceae bacterium]
MARTVADADPARIEATARQFGESRRYLAPVAWAAGAIVLLVRGITLLWSNWRLSLIELVPALYVWFVMWDLKQHALRGAAFREITPGGLVLAVLLAVALTLAAFWCNTVFAFAIGGAHPEIRPAVRRAAAHRNVIAAAGLVVGLIVAGAIAGVPRIGSTRLYVVALSAVLTLLLISLVAVPARITGSSRARSPLRESVGRWAAGGALSATVMAPGFLLDRLGVILLGVPGLHLLGLALLSLGTLLFAAGMASVRAVKLVMKLELPA